MHTYIERFLQFNLWANSEIFEICAGLDEQQLAVETPGVPFAIRPIIAHTIRAECNYIRDLAGVAPVADDFDWDNTSIADLLPIAQQTGAKLIALSAEISADSPREFTEEGNRYQFTAWTVLNQAVNHGIEHRTQLRVLLTVLGVPHPGQSVWGFSESIGTMTIEPTSE